MARSILILGGSSEARQLAGLVAGRHDLAAILSLAGRTQKPLAQPVATRSGGFGGADGLARWLREHDIALLIDATHPFAARMSANAATAARQTGIPLIAMRRPPWTPGPGDNWRQVTNLAEALDLAGDRPRRIFVTLGRQELAPLAGAPQHHYLIRSIDPITPPLDLPHATFIEARGPFRLEDETALLRHHAIDLIIAKNSGGSAARAKLDAARALGLAVAMIARPAPPPALSDVEHIASNAPEAFDLIDHLLPPSSRGPQMSGASAGQKRGE
ncbi:MAG TPA: cobalt-precorrin-6A reductase [Rhodobacteraceae bacterium]|nr:cobalt-precorrin-6A reductase [Paracoccaceae bacterium]